MSEHAIKPLMIKEIQGMSDKDIIKQVYLEHKRTKLSVEAVWQAMFDAFGRQTVRDMLAGGDDSINNDANIGDDSRLTQVAVVYLCVVGLIWGGFHTLIKNEFDALQYAFMVFVVASICITLAFLNVAGKHERTYLSAIHKLQKAYAVFTNYGGFKDLAGKPLDYIEDDSKA